MTLPVIGKRFQHKRTKDVYEVLDVLPIKLDGEWDHEGAVLYTSPDSGKSYVRLLGDFWTAFAQVDSDDH